MVCHKCSRGFHWIHKFLQWIPLGAIYATRLKKVLKGVPPWVHICHVGLQIFVQGVSQWDIAVTWADTNFLQGVYPRVQICHMGWNRKFQGVICRDHICNMAVPLVNFYSIVIGFFLILKIGVKWENYHTIKNYFEDYGVCKKKEFILINTLALKQRSIPIFFLNNQPGVCLMLTLY